MRKIQALYGGILGLIGYLLSPLSWWNDLFVNFPIAYLIANSAAFFYKKAFLSAFIIAYWLTNIVGIILFHKGAENVLTIGKAKKKYTAKDLFRDFCLCLGYTLLIIILIKFRILKPVTEPK